MPLKGIGYANRNVQNTRRPMPAQKSKLSPGRLRKIAAKKTMGMKKY